ncbi:MAG: DnaB-like helicase C-terminal domain-containing protein [Paludibacteraceae bacterium]|nr:DnaB-like helicase C-terminal domain-containing protein [Paludibacteraceae bacterium]
MEYNSETNMSINEAVIRLKSQIKNVQPNVLKTGFKQLDAFGGFAPGELCVIGARPAMGKTTFLLNLISYMLGQNIPVGLFSADDNLNVNYLSRILSTIKKTNRPHNYEQSINFIRETALEEIPLYLNLKQRMNIAYLRENAIKLKEEKGIKCLFIETIQSFFENEENGISKEGTENVCREIRILAQELIIPIIITSGLNRGPENRPGVDGKIPQIRDLRYSDSIECYADKVFFLHRPEYYNMYMDEEGYDLRGVLEVFVAKNTYGPTGKFRLKFDGEKSQVTDIDGNM